MPFTECQSYIKSAKDTESRAKLKPDCTAEFADVLIAVQSAPYFLNPGLTEKLIYKDQSNLLM